MKEKEGERGMDIATARFEKMRKWVK